MLAAALGSLLGCSAYCILAIAAAIRHRRRSRVPDRVPETPFSILKPLSGLDEGLEDNLRSYFEVNYRNFELLFAVRHASDPAVPVVRRLMAEYATVLSNLIITGDPPYPHAKVYSLQCMLNEARYDLIAMCDSDVRVGPSFCQYLAAEFSNPQLGLVTCPYRAIAGRSFWSRLEALGMNTDFHAGLFTALLIEGARFAVGPTIVARKQLLQNLGGLERVKDYLAEDYMLGRLAAESGSHVDFSGYVIDHRIGSESLRANFSHRLRWSRSSRRSRPFGYIGQFFTFPLPVGLIAIALAPEAWPLFATTCLLRAIAAWTVSEWILKAPVNWLLLPLQDLLAFSFWIAGFFGNSVEWRGKRYILNRDGTMTLAR